MPRSLLHAALVAHLFSAGLYAGGCVYVTAVELPALRAAELRLYEQLSRLLLGRAGLILLPALLVATGTAALLWLAGGTPGWTWPVLFLLYLAILAMTLAFNVPINVELLSGEELPLERIAALRARWALAHGGRTLLACLALLLGAWAATSR